MKGIANPQLKAGRLQIRRNENGKNECRQSLAAFNYLQKICVRFASFTLRLHQSRSTKDGRIVVGQFGNANINAAVVNEAQMLLE